MKTRTAAWLLLITNLPGHNPPLRMRIWRGMKSAGVGLLRDGAYLLPTSESSRKVLVEQATEIKTAGGLAHVLSFDADSPEQNAEFVALFDRTAEYGEAIQQLGKLTRALAKSG
jgi:DNA-binding transcriptional regulator PaaX